MRSPSTTIDRGRAHLAGVDVDPAVGAQDDRAVAHGMRLDQQVEVRGAGVGDVGLAPRLDRERHHDERVQQLQEPLRVLGHVVERELLAVRDRFLGAREERVVERLHLVHRARHALREPLALGRQAPRRRERLEVGELVGQQRVAHRATSARSRL